MATTVTILLNVEVLYRLVWEHKLNAEKVNAGNQVVCRTPLPCLPPTPSEWKGHLEAGHAPPPPHSTHCNTASCGYPQGIESVTCTQLQVNMGK